MTTERRGTLLSLGAVLSLFALRFHEFLTGAVLSFRDAGFFFAPWRSVLAHVLRAGDPPYWNDFFSGGRALAANPNAAVFWPLSPLVLVASPTLLTFANAALTLALFVIALRMLGLSAPASAAGGAVLLFSGVFQSVPQYFGLCAALAPLPLALVLFARGTRPGIAGSGLLLGLSFLGGEPVVTAIGGAALVVLSGFLTLSEKSARPLGNALVVGVLALATAGIQLLPAAGELARSSRGQGLDPRHGALFWSVAPGRLLTLIEPRLVGDPFAEEDAAYWGAATFDAGNPYFLDLALGCIPLALAAAATVTRAGRAVLALAALGAFFATGRYFPPAGALLGALPVFRYPEKWWLLTTFALAAAAAMGWDAYLTGTPPPRVRAVRCAVVLALSAFMLAVLSRLFPKALSGLLEVFALSGGAVSPGLLGGLAGPLLASAAGLALLALLAQSGRVPPRLLAVLCAAFFLLDATRRVVGSLPAGDPGRHTRVPDGVAAVLHEARGGRFFDDGASDPATVRARLVELSGYDPLFPETGAIFGVRYAGENDVDRMAPAHAQAFAVELARLPWGEEKARRLERAGVTLVRTRAPRPDPPGTEELGRLGGDRLVRLTGARPELSLAGAGSMAVVERRSHRLVVDVADVEHGGPLAVLRTYDPNWTARAGGRSLAVGKSADGFLEVTVPAGRARVSITYGNPWFVRGLALSVAALLVALAIAWQSRLSHHPRA